MNETTPSTRLSAVLAASRRRSLIASLLHQHCPSSLLKTVQFFVRIGERVVPRGKSDRVTGQDAKKEER
jgi:hypothetical protein